MTIPQEAIEAAAKALAEAWTYEFEYESDEKTALTALEAALPHIREQIAQEILDKPRAYDIPMTQDPSAYTDAYNRAIEAAARIARGEQQ